MKPLTLNILKLRVVFFCACSSRCQPFISTGQCFYQTSATTLLANHLVGVSLDFSRGRCSNIQYFERGSISRLASDLTGSDLEVASLE